MKKTLILSSCVCLSVLVAGCAGIKTEAKYPTGYDRGVADNIYEKPDSIFGKDGLKILKDKDDAEANGAGIGVNGYLWRAALDTVSFMPLASADPFGGVILTDWYDPEDGKNERFKLNVLILDKKLSANGVQVKVFKQVKQNGSWQDVQPSASMGRDLEDTILTRARQMRVAQLEE